MRGRSLIGVGVAMTMLGGTLALWGTRALPGVAPAVAEVFWGPAGTPPTVLAYEHFLYGVLGGVIAGWGTTLAVIAGGDPRLAWRSLAAGALVWFTIDSGASWIHGAWPNVVLNMASLLGIVATLAWTRFPEAPE